MQGVPNCLNCKYYIPPEPITEDFDYKKAYLHIGDCTHPQNKRMWFRRCFKGKYACQFWHIADGIVDDNMFEIIKTMALRIEKIAEHLSVELDDNKA